jgi:hypothetical protein
MMIVTNTKSGHLPVGGAQYASNFINFIRPSDRPSVTSLKPGERTRVTFVPAETHPGFEVEVYRCPGR